MDVLNSFQMEGHDLLRDLLQCGIFNLGSFKLKSGAFSPVYIDLRKIISYPTILKSLASAIRAKQIELKIEAGTVCGVPYTALPLASLFSVFYGVPLVMKRKEAKKYGTKRIVEGVICTGKSCLIIEDIVTSGSSIIETAEALRKEGLNVQDCIVIVNRCQGGIENVDKYGIKVHPLYDIDAVFSAYCRVNKVDDEIITHVTTYFKENDYITAFKNGSDFTMSFAERAKNINHPLAKRLFKIIEVKKSNLCVAVDTNNSKELLMVAEQLGPHICILKTHIDILNDFSEDVISGLVKLSKDHDFLILEDRKFADIGNTVIHQYKNGLFKIEKWAHLVTIHAIPGASVLKAIKSVGISDNRACILIAQMSSKGTLTDNEYKECVFKMAENNSDFVIGYVAQDTGENKNLIHFCPGVSMSSSGDALGQQYKSPESAVMNGADIIIVGRGIYKAPDIVTTAVEYKTRAFNAYLKRIS